MFLLLGCLALQGPTTRRNRRRHEALPLTGADVKDCNIGLPFLPVVARLST